MDAHFILSNQEMNLYTGIIYINFSLQRINPVLVKNTRPHSDLSYTLTSVNIIAMCSPGLTHKQWLNRNMIQIASKSLSKQSYYL